jgi:hypothetical protein
MSNRSVTPDSVNQTIVFWARDANYDPLILGPGSDGIGVSARVDSDGREGTETALTLTTRDVAGTHKDSAITHVGDGKHEVDLADSFFAAANEGGEVTLSVEADDLVYLIVEKVALANVPNTISGPSNLTVTVTDEDTDDPIESASVKIYRTGESGTKTTDASGEAVYTVTDNTWSYTASANGYDGATGTQVVSGDTSLSIALAAKSVSEPDDPTLATLTVKCVDRNGAIQKGIRIVVQMTKVPASSTGVAFSNAKLTDISGVDGMVSFDLTRGATYTVQRTDTGKSTSVLIPLTGAPSIESFFGP